MNTPVRISVIVCSTDALRFAGVSAGYASLLAGVAHEIIGIHDAASPAEGYNRGMRQAAGEILIFSRDDVLILDPDFAQKIVERTQTFDLLGFVGTDRLITASWYGAGQPHLYGAVAHGRPGEPQLRLDVYGVSDQTTVDGIQALDGFCLIVRREAALATGFDAAAFGGGQLHDLDFCFSAYLAGYRLGVCCDIPVLLCTDIAAQNLKYAERFLVKHIERIAGTRPEAIHGEPERRSATFADHLALRRAWRPDLLRRATLALRRARPAAPADSGPPPAWGSALASDAGPHEPAPTPSHAHSPAPAPAPTPAPAPAPSQALRYWRWMQTRSLDELDAAIFREHAQTLWKRHLLFEFCLVLNPGDEALLADSIDAIAQQYYDGWRLSIFARTPSPEAEFTREDSAVRWMHVPDGADPATWVDAHLRRTAADWIGLFACGTRFAPQLLLMLADYIALHPEWRLIYTDEDALDGNGERHTPLFKPDFNLELLRSTDYLGGVFVEREALLAAGGYSPITGCECYDIALRLADTAGESAMGHIPDVLAHLPPAALRRAGSEGAMLALRHHLDLRGIDADVSLGLLEDRTRRVLYRHARTPKVSIIVPTRNRLELLAPCVESLCKYTAYPDWELLLVDNGSDEAAVPAYYDALCAALPERVRLLRYDQPFNFSAMNNLAARNARGEYLLLLNNDTECIHDDWLDAMMSQAQRPDVGVVGARLLFPDSLRLQHAGLVLGLNGTVGHVFAGALSHDEAGYLDRAQTDQEYSAVTGACLLIRKVLFDEIGGLDEETFRLGFNDVNLCLKVRQRGYRIVWTPFATLLHHGSATKAGDIRDPAKTAAFQQEGNAFYARWAGEIAKDPAWNRNLGLGETNPAVEDELVVPWNPDFHDRPRILVMPVPSQGAAEYRNLTPLRYLHAAGKVQFASICQPRSDFERAPMPAELGRLAPDTLVMHAPVDNVRGQALLRYQRFNSDILRIYALDDLITHIPENNPTYRLLPADAITERLALGLRASHRLVVSTEPLVEAYRHLIDDIRLIPNSVPWSVWGGLQSRRRRGKKLRVGWAGAQQHAGDLRFLGDVVKATSQDVDWVFLGMLPEGVRPFVAEFHDYVNDFAAYPAKLASLDLDLAIAPLEIHPFNEAKSNLRLLEYGILGWPVICTDILPYRTDDPPVTRLPNDDAQWIAAIRERVAEPDALAREGDALREWVKKNYLLENKLDQWLTAFLR